MSATVENVAAELMKLGLDATVRTTDEHTFIIVFVESNFGNLPDATVWPPRGTPSTDWSWGHQFEHGLAHDADAATVATRIKETLA